MYPLYNYNTKPDDYQQCFSNTTADGYREDIRGESDNSGGHGSGSAVNSVIINRDADGVESGETVNHEREIAAVIEIVDDGNIEEVDNASNIEEDTDRYT